jgi:hypothetical protein
MKIFDYTLLAFRIEPQDGGIFKLLFWTVINTAVKLTGVWALVATVTHAIGFAL